MAAREFIPAGICGIRIDFSNKSGPNLVRRDGPRSRAVLAKGDVPALVIQSTTLDTDVNRAPLSFGESTPQVDALSQAFRGATVTVIEGISHFPMLEIPRQTNEAFHDLVHLLWDTDRLGMLMEIKLAFG